MSGIGPRIRQARKQKKLTQSELAHRIGVEQNTISQYESGKREPRLKVIHNIAKATEVPLSSLLPFDD